MKLSELKNMSTSRLVERWSMGGFPFDYMKCGVCLTQHARGECGEVHELLIERMRAMVCGVLVGRFPQMLQENLDELFALRLFYADCYDQPVPASALEEEKEEQHATEQVEEVV